MAAKEFNARVNIIDKDRHDDAHCLPCEHIDAAVNFNTVKAYVNENSLKLLVPYSGCLFEPIERSLEAKHLARFSLLKSLWLLHEDFLFKISINKCMGDGNGLQMEVFKR